MKTEPVPIIRSNPTMCLHCHQIVTMTHPEDADPKGGAWTCPKCGHVYPFLHWKIKKQREPRGR